MARRMIGSTLVGKVTSIVEAIEWAEYIKLLWEEYDWKEESMDIVVHIDCKSLEAALKSAGSIKSKILRIDLPQVKEKVEGV